MWTFHPKPQSKPITVREALRSIPLDAPDSPRPNIKNKVASMMKKRLPGSSLGASLKIGKYFSWVKAAWDKPCMTIPKSTTYGGYCIWHPSEDRSLNGRELARLSSFPVLWILVVVIPSRKPTTIFNSKLPK